MAEEMAQAKQKYIIEIQRAGTPELIGGNVHYLHESAQIIDGRRYETREMTSASESMTSSLVEQVRLAARNLASTRPYARVRIEIIE